MALGALVSVNKETKGAGDHIFLDEVTLVGDDSYPTGGSAGMEALLRAEIGDNREIVGLIDNAANGGYMSKYDKANKKLMLFKSNTAAIPQEESNATDTSGVTFSFLVLSK